MLTMKLKYMEKFQPVTGKLKFLEIKAFRTRHTRVRCITNYMLSQQVEITFRNFLLLKVFSCEENEIKFCSNLFHDKPKRFFIDCGEFRGFKRFKHKFLF